MELRLRGRGEPKEEVGKILKKRDVISAVEALLVHGSVYAPVEKDDHFVFEEIERASDVRLEAAQTVHSAKGAFFPSKDPLVRFDLSSGDWEELPPAAPRFLFGLHPCDTWAMKAFDCWMRDGIPDDRYLRRREHGVIIAVQCLKKCNEDSFCGSMGTYRIFEADVRLTPMNNGYFVEFETEKAREVEEAWREILLEATVEEERELEEMKSGMEDAFSGAEVDLERLPDDMKASFYAPWWRDMGKRCLDCGQCVAVCPTCTCFAMIDECNVSLTECERSRRWDGCMFHSFAEVAGPHNFRSDRCARIRHRMNRKGQWLNRRFGVPFCVGCGRCVTACPVGISPLKVFKRAQGGTADV